MRRDERIPGIGFGPGLRRGERIPGIGFGPGLRRGDRILEIMRSASR